MGKYIRGSLSGTVIAISLLIMLLVHGLIVVGVLPYDFVWGGQINDASSLLVFEGVAIGMTLLFLMITLVKLGYWKMEKLKGAAQVGGWVMFAYFLLNTVGNLASGVTLEKMIFTPVTIVLAIMAFRFARVK